MMIIRKAGERGKAEHGWLSSSHTFSFGGYHDPKQMGVSVLRVINDDRVAPGRGFSTHSHRDMEILSYVLEGELAHQDSMGNGSVLRPGQIQLMSAGRGVTHSEFNHSTTDVLHFLQIWIIPNRTGEAPSYQETAAADRSPGLSLIVSPEGRAGSLAIKQDVRIYAGQMATNQMWSWSPPQQRRLAYLHVARGGASANGVTLGSGDGATFLGESAVDIASSESAELLFFDLPPI